jgi:two-component system chemotaxis sensor kinase CheA
LVGEDEQPDDTTVWGFIFRPGFSTAAQVSNISGRGVGMDVVRNTVQAMHGRIQVDTHPGQGSCITLIIPLTLAFMDGLVVRSCDRLYTLPIEAVEEVFKPRTAQIVNSSADGSELVDWHERLAPVGRLQRIYGEGQEDLPLEDQIIVIIRTRQGPYGLPVDEIIGQQQVTVKPLTGFMRQIRGSTGCALLESGEVAIALDADRLFLGGDQS